MFFHLREAMIYVWKVVAIFFRFFWLGLIILFNWSKDFAPIGSMYAFLLPKIVIIVVGLIATNIPFWLLVLLSFLPLFIMGPVLFIAFIIALAH